MTQKLYHWGGFVVWVAMLILMLVESSPLSWGWNEVARLVATAAITLAIYALLAWSDRFAEKHGMGEARFDENGKLIKDD